MAEAESLAYIRIKDRNSESGCSLYYILYKLKAFICYHTLM